MKYKLIVSDMDGTLLGDNHKITEENKIAKNLLQERIIILLQTLISGMGQVLLAVK